MQIHIHSQNASIHLHHQPIQDLHFKEAVDTTMVTKVDFDTTPTPPAPGERWPGQGGFYVCTLPAQFGLPERHLVLASAAKEGLQWGGYDNEAAGTSSQVDGLANTIALLADGLEHPAAKWAASYTEDGHTDYYLPSRFELFMCWMSAPQLFKKEGWYWSSSQYSRHSAWAQDFEYGYSTGRLKGLELRARPVRTIQLQPFNA